MVADGDPGRRGIDHAESFGACPSIKDGVHRRTLRRKLGAAATQHKRRKAGGSVKRWQQRPLAVSRVMQAFRDIAVREKLLREAASLPYLRTCSAGTPSWRRPASLWPTTRTPRSPSIKGPPASASEPRSRSAASARECSAAPPALALR